MPGDDEVVRVGLAGLGAIGEVLLERLGEDGSRHRVTAVCARREDRARKLLDSFGSDAAVVAPEDLGDHADVIVEAVPAALLRQVVKPALERRRDVMVLSCGALLDNWDLVELAEHHGGRIHVPTGALLGLDAVQAAAQGNVTSIRMITRKPPRTLAGTPHVEEHGIDLDSLTEPLLLFKGSPREAIVGFPANLNVAVALSLAGIGPDDTQLEVWADPSVQRNTHHIEVESDSAHLNFSIENIISDLNGRTGRITPLSVLALLKKLDSHLRIGT